MTQVHEAPAPVLPPGMTESAFERVLTQLGAAVGSEHVLTEPADLRELHRLRPPRVRRLAVLPWIAAEQDQRPVWFVPLADLLDARLLADKVAVSLGLPRSPQVPPMEQVVAFLSHRAASARAGEAAAGPLLVLDNFEHLVAEGSGLVRELLERANEDVRARV